MANMVAVRPPAPPRGPTGIARPPGLPGRGLVGTRLGVRPGQHLQAPPYGTGTFGHPGQQMQQLPESVTHTMRPAPPPESVTHNMVPAPPHPGAPGAPGAPTAPGSATTQPAPSPLDSTYYGNVAANTFKVGNDINALGLQGTQNDTALQNTLGQLAYQEPRAQLALEQKANQSGGLYSTVYGQNLGDLTHGYTVKQNAAQTTHDNLRDTIAAKIAALQGGIPIYNAGQAADAAARSALLAANNPGLGQGTGGLNTTPGSPHPPAAPGGHSTLPPENVTHNMVRAPRTARNRLAGRIGEKVTHTMKAAR